jgi:hypothetical protein
MADPVKNTTTQNITSLTYKATGINNSERTISEAMTALYFGIAQWGTYVSKLNIQTAINAGDITLDTYIAFDGGPGVGRLVDTAGNILELYAL